MDLKEKVDNLYNKYIEIEKGYNLKTIHLLKRPNDRIISFIDGGNEYLYRQTYQVSTSGFFKKNYNGKYRKITERTFRKNFINKLHWCQSSKL